jgi:diadenosine tetraphosphate (Ap4A) HIT family hydrolase
MYRYKINNINMGNSLPLLHTHIVPRYLSEPEELRKGDSRSYPQEQIDAVRFDYERDRELIQKLSHAIQKHL